MESVDTTKKDRWAGYEVESKETGQGSITWLTNEKTKIKEKTIMRNADGSMQTLESYPQTGKLKESVFYDENGVVRKRIKIVWAPNGQDFIDFKEFTYDKQGNIIQYESPTDTKRAIGQNPYLETLRRHIVEKLQPHYANASGELDKEAIEQLLLFVDQELGSETTQ